MGKCGNESSARSTIFSQRKVDLLASLIIPGNLDSHVGLGSVLEPHLLSVRSACRDICARFQTPARESTPNTAGSVTYARFCESWSDVGATFGLKRTKRRASESFAGVGIVRGCGSGKS